MTQSIKYDVIGLGNALLDVIVPVTEDFIDDCHLIKGGMTLVSSERADFLYQEAKRFLRRTQGHIEAIQQVSGGSAANTIAGIAALGGAAAYVGRVGKDIFGDNYLRDFQNLTVATPFIPKDGETGRCFVFVTPDAQRTMETFLGIAIKFSCEDLSFDSIAASKILYLEGYLWDPPLAKEAFLEASRIAHRYKRRVALSLSDSFCVERHREDFKTFIKEYVDILFANEGEILSLTQSHSIDHAIEYLKTLNILAAVTCGEKGSLLVNQDVVMPISSYPTHVVDTTGAGDAYASGVLFGLAQEYPLEKCGMLGSQCAAHVISHFGGRPKPRF